MITLRDCGKAEQHFGEEKNALNEEQRKRAVEAMTEYLAARRQVELDAELDRNRVKVIEGELKQTLQNYFSGDMGLTEFKSRIDGVNKRNELWGFRGIKGQMFFNMVVNVADNVEECDQELKSALALPENEQIASSRIKTFLSYVNRLGEQWVKGGNTRYGIPKSGSIPFFLSYFWQIQSRFLWPVYYTTAVQALTDLNIWRPSDDIATDYIAFKRIHEVLTAVFSETSGKPFDLYAVEHVFWYVGQKSVETVPIEQEKDKPGELSVPSQPSVLFDRLPESYVPPIIGILPLLARNDTSLLDAAKRSGTSIPRALEKNIDAAFTILGFETKLMGQGQGRVPDGRALAIDDNYGILWDAKARTDSYSLGTDDRVIREYVTNQTRELSRRYRNIYYMIISSSFAEDFDDAIASMKMETDVSEVILLDAEALVAIVEAKLRAPLNLTLGPDGLQRLFTRSGRLTAAMVREYLA